MSYLTDFNAYPRNNFYYGGDAGLKYGITIDGGRWMLKFPKSTSDLRKPQRSYTTSPMSEYVGSRIFELLGIDVHETRLGVRDGKLVVACRDFVGPGEQLIEFKSIKNSHIAETASEPPFESSSGSITVSSGGGVDLEEVLYTLKTNETLQEVGGAEDRFWDMFVVDALIGNNDRNNMNWGIIVNSNDEARLAPVYDNGNAFFNKRGDEQMAKRLSDEAALEEDAFGTLRSTYTFVDESGEVHRVNPLAFMESEKDRIEGLARALRRFSENLDLDSLRAFIDEIPEQELGVTVMSSDQRSFYQRILEMRGERILEITRTVRA